MTELPANFDQWVNDNNPPVHLQYGKGWWDYIEILRRLMDKFGIEDAKVVGTYMMKTPPPQEELLMPVVKMNIRSVEVIVKYDFGTFPQTWTVSVQNPSAKAGPTLGLFDKKMDLRPKPVAGFRSQWICPPYCDSPTRFSCELADEWDLAALLRLVSSGDA